MAIQHIRTMENWKALRRKRTFTTEGDYTTGSINAITAADTTVNGTSTLWITNAIRIGRRIKIHDDTEGRVIATITAEGTLTLATGYGGTTSAAGSLDYTILGTEEYILPFDWGELGIFWHEAYGYPFKLEPVTDREFYSANLTLDNSTVPQLYRLWGSTGATQQPLEASVITAVSSNASDTVQTVRIEGLVSNQWDFEDIDLNGTTSVAGSKSFTRIDRVSLWDSSASPTSNVGRITLTSNSANVTNLVIPVNFVNQAPLFYKFQLYPLPDDEYVINVDAYDRLHDLVDDNDVCPLGKEFDEAIVLWASYIGWNYNQDVNQANRIREDFRLEMRRLRNWNNKDNDRIYRFRSKDDELRGRTRDHFLDFGPYYPRVPK